MRSRRNETYTYDFKLNVLELYLTKEVSYQELALSVGMNNPSLIVKWVNDFRIAGPDTLRPKQRGRPSTMPKPKKDKLANLEDTDIDSGYLRKLEDENLRLRIEKTGVNREQEASAAYCSKVGHSSHVFYSKEPQV